MNYFLAKTDPETYSLADLKKEQQTNWDGVHNYTAIATIKSWKPGDLILIYHSQDERRIVGLAKVMGEPEFDANDKKGISWMAKVAFVREFSEEQKITLKEIKETGMFDDFALVRLGRLSTMPCPPEFITWLKKKNLDLSAA
ncbi:EVE domain-containing protein [soil metagenome]